MICKIIRIVQSSAVLLIFWSCFGFGSEIYQMLQKGSIELADLLLLFIYVEVMVWLELSLK